jgi:hypothetical protein
MRGIVYAVPSGVDPSDNLFDDFEWSDSSAPDTYDVTQSVAEVFSWDVGRNDTMFDFKAGAPLANYILRHQGLMTFRESGFYTFYLVANNYARFSVEHPNATIVNVGGGVMDGNTTVFILGRWGRILDTQLAFLSSSESIVVVTNRQRRHKTSSSSQTIAIVTNRKLLSP